MRAVKVPELDLPRENRDALRKVIAKAMLNLGAEGRNNEATQRKAYEELRARIFNELTPAQQSTVSAAIKEMEADTAAVARKIREDKGKDK